MNRVDYFKTIIDEIEDLIRKGVTSSSPEFKAWKARTERFLIREFGQDSYELKDFRNYRFTLTVFSMGTPTTEFASACARDLRCVEAVFQTYLEDMKETDENEGYNLVSTESSHESVFIVHGHNEAIKQSVARLVEKQGISAVILHEQPNQGATIIEKFEANSGVGAAICLFSADDIGRSKESSVNNSRARQNVVFETGFFMGKLGRNHVIVVADRDVEIPSDMQGIVYTDSRVWEYELLKELKAMGYGIDMNKTI